MSNRGVARLVCIALIVLATQVAAPADAEERDDFHATVERAIVQYRVALTTLETRGQAETAAEVHRLRGAWQAIGERFAVDRPAAFANDKELPGLLMQVDMRFVGLLLVIDLGNREAARDALLSIGETLSKLNARAAPAP
jgi:hypothetical protein